MSRGLAIAIGAVTALLGLIFMVVPMAHAETEADLAAMSPQHRQLFESLRQRYLAGELSLERNVITEAVEAPRAEAIRQMPAEGSAEYERLRAIGAEALARGEVGVVVLAGGMATRFGGGAKGTVPVVGEKSFIELKVEDAVRAARRHGSEIPVYLMVSFATEEAIEAHARDRAFFGSKEENLKLFRQTRRLPRLTETGDIHRDGEGKPSFYATGHGEFREAFVESGMLADFRSRGGKTLFFSNVDNVLATVDEAVIGHHIDSGREMTVECAPKAPGDKGGAPALVEGKLQLVEGFRFPESFDQDRVRVFNTNNLLFDAEALERPSELGWYTVTKKVDGKTVVQFEQIVGEMSARLDADFLQVSREGVRSRFAPIKLPSDLESQRDVLDQALRYRWNQADAFLHASVEPVVEGEMDFLDLNRRSGEGEGSPELRRFFQKQGLEGRSLEAGMRSLKARATESRFTADKVARLRKGR